MRSGPPPAGVGGGGGPGPPPAGPGPGMVTGLVASTGAMALAALPGPPVPDEGTVALLCAQPALWSVPLAFAVMIGVSLRDDAPASAEVAMLRLHLDDKR